MAEHDELRRSRRGPGPGERVRRVEFLIANGCNIHCSFCCESDRIGEHRFMPWSAIEANLRRFSSLGYDLVQFLGGEATLHPRFIDALSLARELGLSTYVITNLLRWRDPDFALQVGPLLDEVMISLHAWGADAGEQVTGSATWWSAWRSAAEGARRTLSGRIRASTVLTRHSVDDLEQIGEELLRFAPHAWIMGNAVPTAGTRTDPLDDLLPLTELAALRPRLLALSRRCAEAGCRLVFFAFPHCVLGPDLWDDAHDLVIDDQDLSDSAAASPEEVTFWSRSGALPAPTPVVLGRARLPECRGCLRESLCGGHFSAWFSRHGTGGLRPILEPPA